MSGDILDWSADEIVAAIAKGSISAGEVVAAFLRRIDEVNPAVNAVCTLDDRATAEAAACDRRRAAGEAVRPLEGVPFLVKDIIETEGVRTTFGSQLLKDHVPGEDAIAVARLKAAGAILLGKTNTPEFATDIHTTNALFGPTRNPWNLNASPGGSSGGAGAALAAAMAPIGLGTDLGGSIRLPASFNGIVGLRPAQGRVPVYPQEFAWDTLVAHVHGPMARTVADVGRMLAVLAGPDDRDPSSLPAQDHDFPEAASGRRPIAGRRFAYCGDLGGLVPVDPEVAGLAEAAARRFESLGCAVEEARLDASDLPEIISGTRAFNMVARYADRHAAHGPRMAPALVSQIEGALKVDLRAVTRAERLRTGYWHRVRTLLERFDYLLTPTIGAPPFRLDAPFPTEIGGKPVARYHDMLLTCYAFSVTGLPAISLPCGFTRDGLPVGLQIVARRHREDRLLEAAAAYAQAAGEFFRRPEIDLGAARPVSEALGAVGIRIG